MHVQPTKFRSLATKRESLIRKSSDFARKLSATRINFAIPKSVMTFCRFFRQSARTCLLCERWPNAKSIFSLLFFCSSFPLFSISTKASYACIYLMFTANRQRKRSEKITFPTRGPGRTRPR